MGLRRREGRVDERLRGRRVPRPEKERREVRERRRMHRIARHRFVPRNRGAGHVPPRREDEAPLGGEHRIAARRPLPRLHGGERRIELALRAERLREQPVEAGARGHRRDGRVEPSLGLAGLPLTELERGERLDELDVQRDGAVVALHVLERAREGAHRRRGELRVEPLAHRRLERNRREALGRVLPRRRVPDGTSEVQHRRQAVVRAAPQRIVQRAALCAEDALEGLPLQLAQPAERADLPAEPLAELLERAHQRRARVEAVEVRFDPGPLPPVARVEREQLEGPVTVDRRLERTRQHDRNARRRLPATRDVLPRGRRHERLDRRQRAPRRLALLAAVELRHGEPPSVQVDADVDQRRKTEPQTPPFVGNAERDDDGAGRGHERADSSSAWPSGRRSPRGPWRRCPTRHTSERPLSRISRGLRLVPGLL